MSLAIDKFIHTTEGVGDYAGWYAPNTEWKLPETDWLKLDEKYSFDLERMRDQIFEIKEKFGFQGFPLRNGRKRFGYQGIGLTCRPESNDKLYDALHLHSRKGEMNISDFFEDQAATVDEKIAPLTYERNFSERTDACYGYVSEILDRFENITTKVRILELKPNGVIFPHVDFPYYEQIRLHAVIDGGEDTTWEVNGKQFQIPADGNFYWFDTGKYHTVYNKGDKSRIVLSINLSLYKDRDDNPINQGLDIDEFLRSNRL